MRAREFIRENAGSTMSGNIAPVTVAMGEVISRQTFNKPTKYMNALTRPFTRKQKDVDR